MKHKILLIILSAFLLQSCQKELSEEAGTSSIIQQSDSTYLSKIYLIGDAGVSNDTLDIKTYNYDNLKRVVSLVDTSKDLYNVLQQSYYYYYHNTDTLPYKTVLYEVHAYDPANTMLEHDTTTRFHLFDNAGRNIQDSVITAKSNHYSGGGYYYNVSIHSYSYAPDKIYGNRHTLLLPGSYPVPDRKDTASLDAAGNIIHNVSWSYNMITSSWDLLYTSDFTYDTKPSPFSLLSNFKTFGVFPNGETFLTELPQRNNRLTQNEYLSYDYTYVNTYNSLSLVKDIKAYPQPVNTSNFDKVILTYKAL